MENNEASLPLILNRVLLKIKMMPKTFYHLLSLLNIILVIKFSWRKVPAHKAMRLAQECGHSSLTHKPTTQYTYQLKSRRRSEAIYHSSPASAVVEMP